MSGPPLAGHVSALCVRLEILRAASASLSLTGPQRPDCATPGLSSSAPGPSPTGRGPDSYPRRLSPPTELNTLPSAPRPQPPCRPSRALGPPPSSYCSVCLSQPPVPSAPSCSSRVALRTWFCPSLHTSHRGQTGAGENAPELPPPLAKAAPSRQSDAGSVLLLVPPWAAPWGLGKGPEPLYRPCEDSPGGRSRALLLAPGVRVCPPPSCWERPLVLC